MTRRISLIIGIAVAALTVAVPTALAEGRLAGSQEPDGVAFFRANEMATLAQQSAAPVSRYRDAHERSGAVVNQSEPQWMTALRLRSVGLNKQYGLGEFAQSNVSKMSPSERAATLRGIGLNKQYGLGEFATGSTQSGYRDAHERAVPVAGTGDVSTISSGREIEWPKIGIGLGIGIVLVLGLILGLKATRNPPLAH